MEISLK